VAENDEDAPDDVDEDEEEACEIDVYEAYMAEDPRGLSDDDRDEIAKAFGMTRESVDAMIEQMGATRDLVKQQRQDDPYYADDEQ